MKSKTAKIVLGGAIGIAAVIVILFVTHVICIHQWENATCTEPETCSICGDTRGTSLGHDLAEWVTVIEPTCIATGEQHSTCLRCGQTFSEKIPMTEEHEVAVWTLDPEPTCSSIGRQHGNCVVCGVTVSEDIPKVPHTDGEWVVTEEYVVHKDATVTPGVETLYCAVCGEEVDTREYTIELTLSQKNAVISAVDYIDFWHPSYDYLVEDLLVYFSGFDYADAVFGADHCGADWDEQAILYAKNMVAQGESRNGIIGMMRYEKFTEEQIALALEAVGY